MIDSSMKPDNGTLISWITLNSNLFNCLLIILMIHMLYRHENHPFDKQLNELDSHQLALNEAYERFEQV